MTPRQRLLQRWMKGEVHVLRSEPSVYYFGPAGNPFRLVELSDGHRLFIEVPR
jgi:hypothetical protein